MSLRVPIVIVGHGGFPDGLRSAAEMIIGPQADLDVVALDGTVDLDVLTGRIIAAADGGPGRVEDILVLADLQGGSPSNAALAAALADSRFHVLTGANLAMLIQACESRGSEAGTPLVSRVLAAAAAGVCDAAAEFRGGAEADEDPL